MKRLLTAVLAVTLVAAVCATGATATFGPNYPTSVGEGHAVPAAQFNDGANTGFTSFAYFNEIDHGDVAGIELWGRPAAVAAEAEPAPAATVEAEEPAAPAPAVTAPTPAPRTGNASIFIALGVLVATAFVTVKLTKAKNKA